MRPRIAPWRQFDEEEGAAFVCYVNRDMRMRPTGDLEVTFVVPMEFKHLAVGLSDVMGIPLLVDCQVWRPYRERMEARHAQ